MARTTHILRSPTPLRDLAAMTDPTTPPSLLDELKRRKVVRVGLVYGAVAFAILEGVDVLVEALTLPDVVRTVIAVAALGGFPLALALVWAFEATPEGVQRDRGDAGGGAGSWLTARSLVAAVLFTSLGLGAGWLAGRGGAGETTDSSPATEGASIAVLPFLDLSPGGDQAYFADGLAEELLNVLVRSQDLKVAARTSSFAFRENRDIREIGNTLGVSTVVEGSVRRAGDRLRVTAQLIQVSDGFHLWSQTFDGSASDVFAVQDSIAAAIAGALQVTLGVALDLPRQARGLTDDVDAHDLYLLGLHRWRTRNPEQLQEAIGFFEQALGVDSTFALAYTGVAWVWSVASVYDFSLSPREAISQAKDALARAQALSPDLPEAVAIGGFIVSEYDLWHNDKAGWEGDSDYHRELHEDGGVLVCDSADPADHAVDRGVGFDHPRLAAGERVFVGAWFIKEHLEYQAEHIECCTGSRDNTDDPENFTGDQEVVRIVRTPQDFIF